MNVATRAAQGIAFPKDAPATARSALRLLQNLRHGALTLYLPDGSQRRFGEHPQQHTLHTPRHPSASITLHNWNVFGAALKSGDIGFAESYIAGDWSTPNLTELLKVFSANRQEVDAMIFGTWFGRFLYRVKHLHVITGVEPELQFVEIPPSDPRQFIVGNRFRNNPPQFVQGGGDRVGKVVRRGGKIEGKTAGLGIGGDDGVHRIDHSHLFPELQVQPRTSPARQHSSEETQRHETVVPEREPPEG